MAKASHIAANGHSGKTPPKKPDPALAQQWLEKILANWVTTTRKMLPGRIERELGKVRQAVAKGK